MREKRKLKRGWNKGADADDPLDLIMTQVPSGNPEVMATCLVEEYARMGMEAEEILALFRQPIYQTHALYRERGEAWVRDLIRKVLSRSGRMRISITVLHHIGESDG